MKTYVISLDRTPQRLAQFRRDNHLFPEIEHFSAVDGQTLSREALQAQGLIKADLKSTQAVLGCACSHRQLWLQAQTEQEILTICEDDAILHHDFKQKTQRVIDSLPQDWDIILWGWNFDAILLAAFTPPLSPCLIRLSQEAARAQKYHYIQQPVEVAFLRLSVAFGMPCYSISPKGAALFLKQCFPLHNFDFIIPEVNFRMAGQGIDIVMNTLYRSSQSFVCFPPLVLTDNDHTISTVQKQP